MKALALTQTDLLLLPLFTVVLFVALFAAMVAWIYRPGASATYAERSRLPLDEDPEVRS